MVADKELRTDINLLGEFLGEVIREQAGLELFELEEQIRQTAIRWRQNDGRALKELISAIRDLDDQESLTVIKAFSVFFDLTNLAEDVHRVRVLREREKESYPKPRSESIGAAVKHLHARGYDSVQLADLFSKISIKPVFTAHPTEAKRSTVRKKLHRIRQYLKNLHNLNLLQREKTFYHRKIKAEITSLWQTDLLHQRRPNVLDEVKWGLGFMDSLWVEVTDICRDLDRELEYTYPDSEQISMAQVLSFGSWIGGDRDGNPHVSADVTEEALLLHRKRAIELHLEACENLYDSLSPSLTQVGVNQEILDAIQAAVNTWGSVGEILEDIPESEVYRQWLGVIKWRLDRTSEADSLLSLPSGSYRNGPELVKDITLMKASLNNHRGLRLVENKLQDWLNQSQVFGLHLMQLDIREDAGQFGQIVEEILKKEVGVTGFTELPEKEKRQVLAENSPGSLSLHPKQLSGDAEDIITLFRVLREVEEQLGQEWVGNYIMSMTHQLSDILVVLWLGKLTGLCQCDRYSTGQCHFSIVPLFETIDDLENAPDILETMFSDPQYAGHLERTGGSQTVMIGYSDSTKDGGYLPANWNLYYSQQEMARLAQKYGIKLVFFHGRGGTLGRGGGPAARSILSLPPESVRYGLSMTEQGEILAERYGDPSIAHRHLEQIIWATLLVERTETSPDQRAEEDRQRILERLADYSFRKYKALINKSGFLRYFDEATPISEVENLPIGSRPAHRGGERNLQNLRAIPWVFSWTQNRHFLPAWYGLGSAVESFIEYSGDWHTLSRLYNDWPFFRAVIDNASLALKKTDPGIAEQYQNLMKDNLKRNTIWTEIKSEYQRSLKSIKRITGQSKLLDNTPWLQHSITIRNPYVDPLNLLQIEWLKRKRGISAHTDEYSAENIENILRYSIQGIASGLRSTG